MTPFVPVTLVQENWEFGGFVQGKTPAPISGGGTWQTVTEAATLTYNSGMVQVQNIGNEPLSGTDRDFRYSTTLTDATISTTPYMDFNSQTFLILAARATPGPNISSANGYFLIMYSQSIQLYKLVSGTFINLTYDNIVTSGLPVSLTVKGSTITVKVDGVTVIETTDSSVPSAGYFGGHLTTSYYDSDSVWLFNTFGPVTIQTA